MAIIKRSIVRSPFLLGAFCRCGPVVGQVFASSRESATYCSFHFAPLAHITTYISCSNGYIGKYICTGSLYNSLAVDIRILHHSAFSVQFAAAAFIKYSSFFFYSERRIMLNFFYKFLYKYLNVVFIIFYDNRYYRVVTLSLQLSKAKCVIPEKFLVFICRKDLE